MTAGNNIADAIKINNKGLLHLLRFVTSFLHHSGFLIQIIHPPSFEHAGLTCYTLLSPSITFSLFHSELKTYLFRKSYPPP